LKVRHMLSRQSQRWRGRAAKGLSYPDLMASAEPRHLPHRRNRLRPAR